MKDGIIGCTGCERTFNAAMKACPFCGADRALPVHDTPIRCPLCAGLMVRQRWATSR